MVDILRRELRLQGISTVVVVDGALSERRQGGKVTKDHEHARFRSKAEKEQSDKVTRDYELARLSTYVAQEPCSGD
jgi:hypothetical protein